MCPNTADRRVTFSERREERKGLIRKKIGDGAQSGEKGRPRGVQTGIWGEMGGPITMPVFPPAG